VNDNEIHAHIEKLVAEEHELWERESQGNATDSERERMAQLKVALDQSWDLLRQRRALRNVGRDPDEAETRTEGTVENYRQ
jgi:Protein of unknown function (DUF2630)